MGRDRKVFSLNDKNKSTEFKLEYLKLLVDNFCDNKEFDYYFNFQLSDFKKFSELLKDWKLHGEFFSINFFLKELSESEKIFNFKDYFSRCYIFTETPERESFLGYSIHLDSDPEKFIFEILLPYGYLKEKKNLPTFFNKILEEKLDEKYEFAKNEIFNLAEFLIEQKLLSISLTKLKNILTDLIDSKYTKFIDKSENFSLEVHYWAGATPAHIEFHFDESYFKAQNGHKEIAKKYSLNLAKYFDKSNYLLEGKIWSKNYLIVEKLLDFRFSEANIEINFDLKNHKNLTINDFKFVEGGFREIRVENFVWKDAGYNSDYLNHIELYGENFNDMTLEIHFDLNIEDEYISKIENHLGEKLEFLYSE
jgi:hypothetical protein